MPKRARSSASAHAAAPRRHRRLKFAVAGLSATLVAGFAGHALATPGADSVQVTSQHYTSKVSDQAWKWPRHRRHPVPSPTATPTSSPTVAPVPTKPPSPPATTSPGGGGGGGGGSTPTAGTAMPAAGVPDGLALKRLGQQTVTKSGTVIDGADISGGVVVAAPNVVIKNSRISGQGDTGIYVRSGSLTVQDTTITGFDNSVAGDDYTAIRVEVTKADEDGFKIGSNVTIRDSWCHDLVVASGAHSDCGQVQDGVRNTIIRGNWFDVGSGDGNAALFLAPDLGPSTPGPLVVENNVLGGGNFSLQCVDGNNGQYFIGNITIRNNAFLGNSRYGPLRVNVPATITGNIMQASKKAVTG